MPSPSPSPSPAPISPAAQHQLLDQLRKHLEAELAVQRRLLVLAEQMTPRLIAGDNNGFARLTAEEDAPAREAARLRQIREKLVRALTVVFPISGTPPTLSRLLPLAPEPVRLELERLRRELAQVCSRLSAASARNLALVRQGLALVRDLLGGTMGEVSAPALYDRRGLSGTPIPLRGRVLDLRG
jgi:hypothetical protein